MKDDNKIVLVCDSVERYFFFNRFKSTKRKSKFIFFTTEPLVYFLCHLSSQEVVYIRSSYSRVGISDDTEEFISLESLKGDLSVKDAKNMYISYQRIISKEIKRRNIKYVCVWNGQQLLGKAVSSLQNELGYEILFMEISNFPNKLFIDKLGVNAASSLFIEPNKIDGYTDIGIDKHKEWISIYERYKKGKIPQATTSYIAVLYKIINKILCITLSPNLLFKKALWSITPTPVTNKFYTPELVELDSDYIFCPLQVSDDTQILINSEFNNFELIDYAISICNRFNLELFVKIHPAEKNKKFINKVIALKKKHKFKLVVNNTNDLIENSTEVIVINSTVGIESLIYKKKTTILGRALYSSFDDIRLRKYIHSFLVDGIDYFGEEDIDIDMIIKGFVNEK